MVPWQIWVPIVAALTSAIGAIVSNKSVWLQIPVLIVSSIFWAFTGVLLYTLLI